MHISTIVLTYIGVVIFACFFGKWGPLGKIGKNVINYAADWFVPVGGVLTGLAFFMWLVLRETKPLPGDDPMWMVFDLLIGLALVSGIRGFILRRAA